MVGSDEMSPDRTDQRDGKKEYKFSWFTNGYPPTKKGVSFIKTYYTRTLMSTTPFTLCKMDNDDNIHVTVPGKYNGLYASMVYASKGLSDCY